MSNQIIVVERMSDWPLTELDVEVVHVDDYLTGPQYIKQRNIQVINLCRSYRYHSVGYYCSLLAEARGHRVLPSVKTMMDLSSKSIYGLDTENLETKIQKAFKKHAGEAGQAEFDVDIMFGRCDDISLQPLMREIYELFPSPLLSVHFVRQGAWRINAIKARQLKQLVPEQWEVMAAAFDNYRKKRRRVPKGRAAPRFDIAILRDPEEQQPPSNAKALERFVRAGRELDVNVELIDRKDYSRLAEYDALFIRTTTRINHYTYRFAKKAESEKMVVLDDPNSILRCTNKVYLAELLRTHHVPTPKTVIVGRTDLKAAEQMIGYPMVLKIPDGSFSLGVYKAENSEQMHEVCTRLLKKSELVLAQEYMYTEYDWRIGVLNRKPFFASQYFMSKKHWQIVKYDGSGGYEEGGFKTVAVDEVPEEVLSVALKAANLIGDGLYGVDLKQNQQGVYVIEVNDNPNLDAGVEDAVLKDELYTYIMQDFIRRLEHSRKRP